MGWETRRGGTYYYRKRRVAGKVVSEYVGASPLAAAIAVLEARDRAERREQAEARRQERELERELRKTIAQTTAEAETLAKCEGIERRRGEWRKATKPNSKR